MATIKGIDVSYHNGVINWKTVKEQGIKFAVLREGFRKSIDSQFLNNVKGCQNNNIPIMVYHFIYTDGATPKENATSTVNNMKKAGLDLAKTWVWADLEYDTWKKNKEKCTKEKCSKYTQQYIDQLQSLGCKKIGVYMNNDYYKNYYNSDIINKYPVWLADYTGEADHKCAIQQYSSSGKVKGINSASVDMNYLFDASMIASVSTPNPAPTQTPAPTADNNSYVGKGIGYATSKATVNVRKGSSASEESYGTIPSGTKVEVLEILSNGWYKIVWPKAKNGYAYTSNRQNTYYTYAPKAQATNVVKKVATEKPSTKKVSLEGTYATTGKLNIRNGAGITKKIMVTIPKGTKVKSDGRYTKNGSKIWLYVSFTYKNIQYTGFASSKYLAKK